MAENISIDNSYLCYISNQPYSYPANHISAVSVNPMDGGSNIFSYNTGWQIIPNMLWKHFCTPKAWFEMLINYEAYHVTGFKISVFNMIPMTTQLAIQGNTVFTAFNNCIYAWAYQDRLYETNWHNWYYSSEIDRNLLYKEGLITGKELQNKVRNNLPVYQWSPPSSYAKELWTWNQNYFRADDTIPGGATFSVDGVFPAQGYYPTGVVWDPLNRPDEIMELRPGKNSIHFTWECHSCDENKWFNLDAISDWWPYTEAGPYNRSQERPGEFKLTGDNDPNMLSMKQQYGTAAVNDYTIANWENIPVVPMQWWWKEIQNSIAPAQLDAQSMVLKYINMFFAGTERECYHYGPTQCFLKLIPMINHDNVNIESSAQIAVRTELKLAVKKRRSALYCPTWGPLPWRAVYSARSSDRNYFGSYIRYRTGGMRRTWQNIGDSKNTKAHPRQTPYNIQTTNPQGTGQDYTRGRPSKPVYTTPATDVKVTSIPQHPKYPPPPPPYNPEYICHLKSLERETDCSMTENF